MFDKVGVRTRRQREEMGDNLRGERLGSQLKELHGEAERGFMAAEMACGAMVSGFEVKEVKAENANVWGGIREKARALENSCECLHSAVKSTHREPVNRREMMKRPEEEKRK